MLTATGLLSPSSIPKYLVDSDIHIETKQLAYKAVIIPILLYASETCHYHLKRLMKLYQCCLWKILKITREDKTTNVSILQGAKTTIASMPP